MDSLRPTIFHKLGCIRENAIQILAFKVCNSRQRDRKRRRNGDF
jgi:hypothetical protein